MQTGGRGEGDRWEREVGESGGWYVTWPTSEERPDTTTRLEWLLVSRKFNYRIVSYRIVHVHTCSSSEEIGEAEG